MIIHKLKGATIIHPKPTPIDKTIAAHIEAQRQELFNPAFTVASSSTAAYQGGPEKSVELQTQNKLEERLRWIEQRLTALEIFAKPYGKMGI